MYPVGVVPQPIIAPQCDIAWSYHVVPDGQGVVLCSIASRKAFVHHLRVREKVDIWRVRRRVTSSAHNCRKSDHHRVHCSLNVGVGSASLSPCFRCSNLDWLMRSRDAVKGPPTTTATVIDACMHVWHENSGGHETNRFWPEHRLLP